VLDSTVATVGLAAVLHAPPLVPSLNIVVLPAHTTEVPVIAAGSGKMVTDAVTDVTVAHAGVVAVKV
jgi:hypothetical protein